MSVICHIDGSEYESVADVHALLKSLRIKQADYYAKHAPRYCKGTGDPIPYKDYKQYFSQEFADKNALKKWIKANPVEGRAWAIEWLRKRKEEKKLIYAPSQAELRSLQCPSMPYYDSVGGYYDICRELGFKEQYVSYTEQNTAKAVDSGDICFICDNREQNPLKLAAKTVKGTLNCGDYGIAPPHDKGVYIERKSISDFAGTLNKRANERKKKDNSVTLDIGLDRFDRELARAASDNHYIVMLVECSITQALSFDYLPQMKWSKVKPSYVFKNLRDLLTKYPLNFQVVFADGRVEAARLAVKILQMGDQVRHIDLEYALERGVL